MARQVDILLLTFEPRIISDRGQQDGHHSHQNSNYEESADSGEDIDEGS